MYDVTRPTIAVVGGGTAAACLLTALSRRLPALSAAARGTVLVYEPRRPLWRGRVYQHDAPEIITNVPVSVMSLHDDDPAHAARWLAHRLDEHAPDAGARFVPRQLIGDYLVAEAEAAQRRLLARGWTVRLVPELVDRIAPPGRRLTVFTRNTATACDFAVLCLGGPEPADPYQLAGHPGYIARPYPVSDSLRTLSSTADIAIIGTGLTAVDLVAGLAARRHQGRIWLTSRHGILPAVRPPAPAHRFTHLTATRLRLLAGRGRYDLAALTRLVAAELASARFDAAALAREIIKRESPLERLHRHLATPSPRGLHILQQAVGLVGQEAWHLLPPDDKHRILAEFHPVVMSLISPMPPRNARMLAGLAATGQLAVLPGLRAVTPYNGTFLVRTRTCTVRAGAAISAVTPAVHAVHPDARPLVDGLTRDGAAVPDPGGGIQVDFRTARVTPSARPAPSALFALGDLTHGSLYFTSGMPAIVQRAADIARTLSTGLTGMRVGCA
ncbi:FAD/NAD(P)-binding protein [Streptomyces sclerotialus]|uniref:FAD/NAD(P)-binding protein n=1 Tax=Streptomyces sclerotialus TaxID=1957 RepID=UPI00068C8E43